MSDATQRPGYLVVRVEPDGTYLGGLMVTDQHGLPLDFRYTDPITPTRLQRVLYGGVLDRYLRSEVVLRTLLAALGERPTVLLVDDERLLDEEAGGCPVALVAPSRAAALGPPGTARDEAPGAYLLQVSEGANPVRVAISDPAVAARVSEALVRLGAGMDLLEPAERVRGALDLIARGEGEP